MGFNDFDLKAEARDEVAKDAAVGSIGTDCNFDKCIILNSREVSNICRLIEPLTKSSLDEYGKSVFFTCVGDTVEIRYFNNPYIIIGKVANHSGSSVRDFAIMVSTLRNFLSSGFSNLVFVEQEGEMNFAFGEQLIYMETKNLRKEAYEFDRKPTTGTIDKAKAQYVFKRVGVVLNQTERASEKVIVVKGGQCIFNTGVLAAKLNSPFSGDESMVVFKQVADGLAAMSEFADDLRYSVGSNLVVTTNNLYIEYPAGVGDRVNQFISPSVNLALQFNAEVEVDNSTLYKLVRLVQSLDYLSEVVKVGFSSDILNFQLTTGNMGRVFPYSFKILKGRPETMGDMNITIGVLKVFLDIVGDVVRFNYNNNGLGIINDNGTFLIRKS